MTVLIIIGVIVAILAAALLILWTITSVNQNTVKEFGYEFFNWSNYIISAIGYWLIFFGHKWYIKALAKNQDILNGQVLIGIGVILIVGVVYYNVRRTSFFEGIPLTLVQLPIYLLLAVAVAIAIFFVVVVFSSVRPVYNLNK